MKEVDAEAARERAALTKRVSLQEDELDLLKRELKKTRKRLEAMESELAKPTAHSEKTLAERASDGRPVPRKNGSA